MNELKPNDFPDASCGSSTYQTGSTEPPKSRNGLIAVLLGTVIFLCGLVTALGMMNFRLRLKLDRQSMEQRQSFGFTQCDPNTATARTSANYFPLGFSGQEISDFWSHYRDLPKGIYITEVCSDSPACERLRVGDILLRVNAVSVTDNVSLTALLKQYRSGDTLDVVLFREGNELTVQLTVE